MAFDLPRQNRGLRFTGSHPALGKPRPRETLAPPVRTPAPGSRRGSPPSQRRPEPPPPPSSAAPTPRLRTPAVFAEERPVADHRVIRTPPRAQNLYSGDDVKTIARRPADDEDATVMVCDDDSPTTAMDRDEIVLPSPKPRARPSAPAKPVPNFREAMLPVREQPTVLLPRDSAPPAPRSRLPLAFWVVAAVAAAVIGYVAVPAASQAAAARTTHASR